MGNGNKNLNIHACFAVSNCQVPAKKAEME